MPDAPKSLIFEDGPVVCPEMAVTSYHSTLCKIPKIAGLSDKGAGTWNQERVYFEFCRPELAFVQNFVCFKMTGVSCG
jgi:hypothetical protein